MVNIRVFRADEQLLAEVDDTERYWLRDFATIVKDLGLRLADTITVTVDGGIELSDAEKIDVWMLIELLDFMHGALAMIPEK